MRNRFLETTLENCLSLHGLVHFTARGMIDIPRFPLREISCIMAEISGKRAPTTRVRFGRSENTIGTPRVARVTHNFTNVAFVAAVGEDSAVEIVLF